VSEFRAAAESAICERFERATKGHAPPDVDPERVERTGISVSPPAKRYMSCVVNANPIKAIHGRCRALPDHGELTAKERKGKHQAIGMETSLYQSRFGMCRRDIGLSSAASPL